MILATTMKLMTKPDFKKTLETKSGKSIEQLKMLAILMQLLETLTFGLEMGTLST